MNEWMNEWIGIGRKINSLTVASQSFWHLEQICFAAKTLQNIQSKGSFWSLQSALYQVNFPSFVLCLVWLRKGLKYFLSMLEFEPGTVESYEHCELLCPKARWLQASPVARAFAYLLLDAQALE